MIRDHTYQEPRCMKTIGQRCFTYLAPKIYSIIPEDLKNTKSFKRQLKEWMSINTTFKIIKDNNKLNKKL